MTATPCRNAAGRRKALRAYAQRLCRFAKRVHDKGRLALEAEALRTDAQAIRDGLKSWTCLLTQDQASAMQSRLDALRDALAAPAPLRDHVAKGVHDD